MTASIPPVFISWKAAANFGSVARDSSLTGTAGSFFIDSASASTPRKASTLAGFSVISLTDFCIRTALSGLLASHCFTWDQVASSTVEGFNKPSSLPLGNLTVSTLAVLAAMFFKVRKKVACSFAVPFPFPFVLPLAVVFD